MSTKPPGRGSSSDFLHSEDQLRLMVRVARMYYEQDVRQSDISKTLHISQPRVSRLLKRASEIGIVRTTVSLPAGVHLDLEEQIEQRYGLDQVVVVDTGSFGEDVTSALGAAAADHLAATLIGNDTVGISSWSATLLALVGAMRPFRTQVVDTVVQLVGGIGDPQVQMQATRLIDQFASNTGAEPLLLPTAGILDSSALRESLMSDSSVTQVLATWERLTVALVGIGAVEPSALAYQSGNVFSAQDRASLDAAGAVGDICFRLFDAEGQIFPTEFNDRVSGITPEQLRKVPRRIGVAGGPRKFAAIQGALLGGWINVLVTDIETARRLLEDPAA